MAEFSRGSLEDFYNQYLERFRVTTRQYEPAEPIEITVEFHCDTIEVNQQKERNYMHVCEWSEITDHQILDAFIGGMEKVVGKFFDDFTRDTCGGRIGSTTVGNHRRKPPRTEAAGQFDQTVGRIEVTMNSHGCTQDVDISGLDKEQFGASILKAVEELGEICGKNRLIEFGAKVGSSPWRLDALGGEQEKPHYVMMHLDEAAQFQDKNACPFNVIIDGANLVIRNPIDRMQRMVSVSYSESFGFSLFKVLESTPA